MRSKIGHVSSDKMDKTVAVIVHTYKRHPKYKKRYRITKTFYAHDELNSCKIGDEVLIEECRPLSKKKRWKVASINGKAVTEKATS